MSYRGPDPRRIARQRDQNIMQHAGHTATWRQFVSASSGHSVAGFSPTPYYREQTVTALFKSTIGLTLTQRQYLTPAGMTTDADFIVVTREPLRPQDELLWQGTAWRIESESVPSRMDGGYINILSRGKT